MIGIAEACTRRERVRAVDPAAHSTGRGASACDLDLYPSRCRGQRGSHCLGPYWSQPRAFESPTSLLQPPLALYVIKEAIEILRGGAGWAGATRPVDTISAAAQEAVSAATQPNPVASS